MFGFKNVNAYIYKQGIVKVDIAIENGKIVKIGNNLDIDEVIKVKDNQVVLPGFIDQHIHGAGSFDAMDKNASNVLGIAENLLKEGTTCFLTTTMTQSKENIINSLQAINSAIKSQKTGAKILGVHLEGPFISKKYIGAQPLEFVKEFDIEFFDELQSKSQNIIKMVTLAPEEKGGAEFVKGLTKRGVISSVAHSDAGYNDIEKAYQNGLSCVSHTFNAQRPIHHREIGVAGTGLLLDGIYTEIICDLIHLSIPAIKLVLKCKQKDKIILITDSMRAKGLDDGISELGGQKVIVKNGEARLENGALAGSTLKMNVAIKNLVENCDVKLEDAVDFATINPATHLKIEKDYGSIEVGKNASFCVLNPDFSVAKTIVDGKELYKA
ncbi:MAG: N-acetylglucosamine-6-phosphate deacetylase [Clostridia bacterium]|nr:N-acetylglucosamine-6-phosphate deacetylase [Clostridia bacterium]